METREAAKLDVTKEFNVPVAKLYAAWVEPDALKQWWHPMGAKLVDVTNDLRPEGKVQYVFEGNNNESFKISGHYYEVKENERLVYSWDWEVQTESLGDSQYRLVVEFSESGQGSQLHVTQENFKNEESIQPHREGWDKSLNDLQQYLSSNQ